MLATPMLHPENKDKLAPLAKLLSSYLPLEAWENVHDALALAFPDVGIHIHIDLRKVNTARLEEVVRGQSV
jgi:hypothetical protein